MPRKKLPLEQKKRRVDLYVVSENITKLGEDNIKNACAKTIDKMLQLDPTLDHETFLDSTNLYDCLEHFDKTKDIEPLRLAIILDAKNKRECRAILKESNDIIQHNSLARTKNDSVILKLK